MMNPKLATCCHASVLSFEGKGGDGSPTLGIVREL